MPDTKPLSLPANSLHHQENIKSPSFRNLITPETQEVTPPPRSVAAKTATISTEVIEEEEEELARSINLDSEPVRMVKNTVKFHPQLVTRKSTINKNLTVKASRKTPLLPPLSNRFPDESPLNLNEIPNSHSSRRHSFSNLSSVNRFSIFEALRRLTAIKMDGDNSRWWSHLKSSKTMDKYKQTLEKLSSLLAPTEKFVVQLQKEAPKYDYDIHTPGNGYRSIVSVMDCVVLQLVRLLRLVRDNRHSVLFRAETNVLLVENYVQMFEFLSVALPIIVSQLESDCVEGGCLFPIDPKQKEQNESILRALDNIDNSCFYSRAVGFQFAPSLVRLFHGMSVVMATYNEKYTNGFTPNSVARSMRFCVNAELRAQRLVSISRTTDVQFCKQFWNLAELKMALKAPLLVNKMPSLACNKSFKIECEGNLQLETEAAGGAPFIVPPPSAHNGPGPVSLRLLCAQRRGNMNVRGKRMDCSPNLLFHCHGGGFVAHSSKSHECYLRHWAAELDCPIISVDYSLAPDSPYPRPTEEVLYAYAWAIHNKHTIGWTGERVCWTGDSAGGNLLASVLVRCLNARVSQLPQGTVYVYTPFLFQYVPSPSRLLHMMDPLLHMGIVMRCIFAYTVGLNPASNEQLATDPASKSKPISNAEQLDPYETLISELRGSQEFCRNPELSAMYCTMETLQRMPPAWFLCGQLDPLLDDTVSFARKLRDAGGQVRAVHLLDGLPHGFLNFTLLSPETRQGAALVLACVKECLGID